MRDGFRVWDTHAHIGAARHSGRRCTAEKMLALMDRRGVDRAMLIPFPVVEDERAAHDEIGRAVQQWPDRFAGAACLYPYADEAAFRTEVRRCREQYGFAALKLQPQYQPVNPLWEASDVVFGSALENGMAMICHTGAGAPFALPSLLMMPARRFPDLKIVVAHCGGGVYVSEAIVAASFCANIYLELSSLMPHQVLEVLRHVPAQRLMAGSDLPESLNVEMGKIVELDVSVEERREILWGTAARVFGEPAS